MGYDKERVLTFKYLLYEYLGVAILTLCYNISNNYSYFIIVVSIWAWNHSGAHFNMAITLGEGIVRSDSLSQFVKGSSTMVLIMLV